MSYCQRRENGHCTLIKILWVQFYNKRKQSTRFQIDNAIHLFKVLCAEKHFAPNDFPRLIEDWLVSLCALDDDRLASRAFRFELACILWPSELESQFDIENTFLPTDLCNLFTFSLFNIHSSKNKLLGWIQFSIYIPGFLS